ncbi:MAG: sodium:proton antiporter [Candidatus Onthomonas sp.]
MRDILLTLYEQRFLVTSVILFVIGFAGMLFHQNLIKKIVGLNIMDTAVYLFLTSAGYVEGRVDPILTDPNVAASVGTYVNPVPAGLVLTGIVVSVSVTAFALALTLWLYWKYDTLYLDDILYRAKRSED